MTYNLLFTRYNKKTLYSLLLIIISICLYSLSFNNDFVWDSEDAFAKDTSIRDIRNIPGFFVTFHNSTIDTEGKTGQNLPYYRPLLKSFHSLEYMVFGKNPTGYNTLNILLNALVVAVAFQLVHVITGNLNCAFLASLLYAVNPTRVEAVSWLISDSYILVALLLMAALLYHHQEKRYRALLLFSAALLVHEQAISFLVVIILYELILRYKRGIDFLLRTMPFAVVVGLYLTVRFHFVGTLPPVAEPLKNPIFTAMVVIQRYVKIFFVPDALITVYEKEVFPHLSAEVLYSLVLAVFLVSIAALLYRKCLNLLLFWYSWFFIWLSLAVTAAAMNRLGEFLMGEKGLYIASLGFCVILARFILSAPEWSRKPIYVATALLILFHASYTFARTTYWKNNMTYFQKAYEFAPNYYSINYALGSMYAHQMRYDEAQRFYRQAITLHPGFSMAYSGLGNIYYLKGDLFKARQTWERAIAVDDENPIPYHNLGMLLEDKGDISGALVMYRRYLHIAKHVPDDVTNHINDLESANKSGGTPK